MRSLAVLSVCALLACDPPPPQPPEVVPFECGLCGLTTCRTSAPSIGTPEVECSDGTFVGFAGWAPCERTATGEEAPAGEEGIGVCWSEWGMSEGDVVSTTGLTCLRCEDCVASLASSFSLAPSEAVTACTREELDEEVRVVVDPSGL